MRCTVACLLIVASAAATAGASPVRVGRVQPMLMPRAAHTATLLGDGRVLVAGGCTRDGCELGAGAETTELYIPKWHAFVRGPRMLRARVGHAAVALADGRVLVAGGWDADGETTAAEVFDPATGAFRATGSLLTPRGGFSATRLGDGRVLFAGGQRAGQALASAEVYDPRTGTFSPTGSLRTARAAHAAVRLRDGRVLVVGGAAAGRVLASAEVFDIRTGRWVSAGRLHIARHKHGAVLLRDGRVLVVGGSDARDWRGRLASAELWRPATRRFVPAGRMAVRRFKLPDAVVRLPSGRVLVAGSGATAETYNPRRGRFSSAGRLGIELFFATATVLPSGAVLVAGGYDEDIEVNRRAWLVE